MPKRKKVINKNANTKRTKPVQAATTTKAARKDDTISDKQDTISEEFNLQKFNLNYTVKIWMTSAQTKANYKRSYIRIINDDTKESYNSLHKFRVHIEADSSQHRTFDVIEYITKERIRICQQRRITSGHKNQYAQTPDSVYDFIRNDLQYKISDFDPCPPNPTFNGLAIDWKCNFDEIIYVNPPFKDSGRWIKKAILELDRNNCSKCVLMLPARMAASWFRLLCTRADKMYVPGRITFKNYQKSYPWGCFLCVVSSVKERNETLIEKVDKIFK